MSKPVKIVLGFVALIAVAVGGLSIYGVNRVDRNLEEMTPAVQATHLAISPFAGVDYWNLSVRLQVENTTSDTLDVYMKRVAVTADERDLGFAEWIGRADVTVPAGVPARFHGQTLVSNSIYEDLKARGEVTYTIAGEITVTDSFLWVTKSRSEPFSLELQGLVG